MACLMLSVRVAISARMGCGMPRADGWTIDALPAATQIAQLGVMNWPVKPAAT